MSEVAIQTAVVMPAPMECGDDARRRDLRKGTNTVPRAGIDYIEVSDNQRTLTLSFIGTVAQMPRKENIRIEGGYRNEQIPVVSVTPYPARTNEEDDRLAVEVERTGDFSPYTLRLVETDANGKFTDIPLTGFDPFYAQISFSFKIECGSDLDCAPATTCPSPIPQGDAPIIDYLNKDFPSFRQLILDRFALLMPNWSERHLPDVLITLVDILAYVGDYLSYYQDAVATEAYLRTARKRISVRRHARLVNYRMTDGCNARVWVHIRSGADVTFADPKQIFFVTRNQSEPTGALTTDDLARARTPAAFFEPLTNREISLWESHNELPFYTWGERECCLPVGATRATLKGEIAHLTVGTYLLFEEVIGPETGLVADADATHRHIVHLTKVTAGQDTLYNPPVPIVEIEWEDEDALPFAVCLSASILKPGTGERILLTDVTVVRGNLVLADSGRTVNPHPLSVPTDSTNPLPSQSPILPPAAYPSASGQQARLTYTTPFPLPTDVAAREARILSDAFTRFVPQEPRLAQINARRAATLLRRTRAGLVLTADEQAEVASILGIDPARLALGSTLGAAAEALLQNPTDTLPALTLFQAGVDDSEACEDTTQGTIWTPVADLLQAGANDPYFVAEMDEFGTTHLRFGDGTHGRKPPANWSDLTAHYRIGGGTADNVGAETIRGIVLKTGLPGVQLEPRNPLAAVGGAEPEDMERTRLLAPHAFQGSLQRAVIADDYATIADQQKAVKQANAVIRWSGCRDEVRLMLSERGKETLDSGLVSETDTLLARRRRIGHTVRVLPAQYVPLQLEFAVCVAPGALRSDVRAALTAAFGTKPLANGSLPFFHPDNFTFGQNVYVSRIIAAASQVTGVQSVQVWRFERLDGRTGGALKSGVLKIRPHEIARLDNDRSAPENGVIKLILEGGE